MVSTPAPPVSRNGSSPEAEPFEAVVDLVAPSGLLQYLPAIYAGDPFIGRFLRIFEDLHTPLRRTASTLPHYFDPTLAPGPLQAALAAWVGAERDGPLARLSREAWGRLIRESVEPHGVALAAEERLLQRPPSSLDPPATLSVEPRATASVSGCLKMYSATGYTLCS